jgi:hypothetical protein
MLLILNLLLHSRTILEAGHNGSMPLCCHLLLLPGGLQV